MKDKAYAYMDWPRIEDLVYAEMSSPKSLLAPKEVSEGTLYQCFFPGAAEVRIVLKKNGKSFAMTKEDEAGYFAAVVPEKHPSPHDFLVDHRKAGDPYSFPDLISEEEAGRFGSGISDRAYRLLGAHIMEAEGTKGILFALWAPNAMRVSVVGPFCEWDGRACPMEYHEESGIWELFIPYLAAGCIYKYELKLRDGLCYTRPDPFGFSYRLGDLPVSVAADLSYVWHDTEYLGALARRPDTSGQPVAILECSLASWKKRSEHPEKENYRTLAGRIADFSEKMHYTHVELTPVMEYPDDASDGYHTAGYFAPTSRYGSPDDFQHFVDTLHGRGIGVILDFAAAQFSPDMNYLAAFDGTCLYEHLDPRQGIHPVWGTRLFNYGRPEVRSFLNSSAAFWLREYHADGLRLDGCSTMLRLDYGRRDGEWIPNLYGTNENLDGIEYLKSLSRIVHREFPGRLLIMEEETDRPDITSPVEDGGLGFDYKWNLYFTQNMLHYLSLDSSGRRNAHDILLNGMIHHYFEHFIISLSRGIGPFDRSEFLAGINGKAEARAALVRAAYVYLFAHPGKKLLADGETFPGKLTERLVGLYRSEPALYAREYEEAGFEWINTMDSAHSVLSFARHGRDPKEMLLVVCNFSDENFTHYVTGVPAEGKYKEILNSDDVEFGGSGKVNPRAKNAKPVSCDERDWSIRLRLAPRSAAIFRYQGK